MKLPEYRIEGYEILDEQGKFVRSSFNVQQKYFGFIWLTLRTYDIIYEYPDNRNVNRQNAEDYIDLQIRKARENNTKKSIIKFKYAYPKETRLSD